MNTKFSLLFLNVFCAGTLQAQATYTIPASATLEEPYTFSLDSADIHIDRQFIRLVFSFPSSIFGDLLNGIELSGELNGDRAELEGKNSEARCALDELGVECRITYFNLGNKLELAPEILLNHPRLEEALDSFSGQPVGILRLNF